MRILRLTLVVPSLLAFLACLAGSASAGWNPDGVTIRSTAYLIPKVAATGDGARGSLVFWQEESTAGSGVLRAQHVMPTGDVDPAWPADGAVLCGTAAARAAIGAVPDAAGGAYVWWKEGAAIYLTRVTAAGAIATGWPARGRPLGACYPTVALPSVIADGAGGVYACWTSFNALQTDGMSVLGVHLGPANTGAGGWPDGTRSIGGSDVVNTWDFWPQLALAPDGGAFMAWAKWSDDPATVPSAIRLRRLTPAGLSAAGWTGNGVALAPFAGEWLAPDPPGPSHPAAGLIGLDADGRGGVFAMVGTPVAPPEYPGGGGVLETRIHRIQGNGQPASDWPAGGTVVANAPYSYVDGGAEAGYRVFGDGFDGAQVGLPAYYDHGTGFGYTGMGPDGLWKPSSTTGGELPGIESVSNGNGGRYAASFYPKGPYGPYEPWAYLRVGQSLPSGGWSDWMEIHFDLVVQWYGDIGLAETGDGGAVFFWSQVRERFGLFARRFNGAGQVTGVPPGTVRIDGPLALSRLRFVPGEGVRASVAGVAGGARLDLYDVAGRRVSGSRPAGIAASGLEVTLPGTATLPSGLYFARLSRSGAAVSGKVIVAR